MYRFLLELFLLLGGGMLVKSVLSSVLKGFGTAASNAAQQQQQAPPPAAPRGNELHKDPVCGTYVSESTSFRRQSSGKTFYYCSDACLQKHAA